MGTRITTGTHLEVVEGSTGLRLHSGRALKVTDVSLETTEPVKGLFSQRPAVTVEVGFGRLLTLYASSVRRLEQEQFRLTDGDPSHVVVVRRKVA